MAELNIAIAEDNPLMLELLGSILEEEDGFHVVGKADNGEDAYQMIMDKKPDIVLLDVIMPKLDRHYGSGKGTRGEHRQRYAGSHYGDRGGK